MTTPPMRPGRRSGKLKLIVLLVVALLLGGAGGYLAFGRKPAPPPAPSAGAEGSQEAGPAAEGDPAGEGEDAEPITYVALGAFLVNVVSEGNLRYLRTEITVGTQEKPVEGKKARKKAAKHGEGKAAAPTLSPADDARARDAVVRVLSSQDYNHLRTTGPSEELKTALTDALTEAVQDTQVKTVMLTSFVMQ